jgi:hypothetical protein
MCINSITTIQPKHKVDEELAILDQQQAKAIIVVDSDGSEPRYIFGYKPRLPKIGEILS